MRRLRCLRWLVTTATLLFAAPLWAGSPVGITSVDTAYSLFSPATGTPVTATIMLSYDPLASPGGQTGRIDALTIGGTNAADFSIVGGTCVAGTTVLSPGSPNCTVTVQYDPSMVTAESGLLTMSCTTLGLIGGFSLSCSTTNSGSISLFGSLAALVSADMLNPRLLTLLSLLLLGIGFTYIARRA